MATAVRGDSGSAPLIFIGLKSPSKAPHAKAVCGKALPSCGQGGAEIIGGD